MIESLTPRQREVMDLLVQGMSTQQIAQKLFISKATARNHINHIMERLGVNSRIAAVYAARIYIASPAQRVLDCCRRQEITVSASQESAIRLIFDEERTTPLLGKMWGY